METDFLTESTRKLRKSLLVASLIGFAISYVGLRVSEVSLLGSKLSITRFEVIPLVLGIIVLYFLVTFIIFGFHDYSQSYRNYRFDILGRLSKEVVYSRDETEEALNNLYKQLERLDGEANYSEIDPSQFQEIKQEISKLRRVQEFYRYYKGSIFERLRLRGMRTFFDLFVPILVGSYVAILLFFFTKIPELNDTAQKPEQNVIVSEKLISNDANQVTSDTLTDSPKE